MAKQYTVFLKSGSQVQIRAEAVKIKNDAGGLEAVFAGDNDSNERITYLDPNSVEAIVEEK